MPIRLPPLSRVPKPVRSGAADRRDVVRILTGAGIVAFTWREALRPNLPDWEGLAFDAINHLPEGFRASWPIMQCGSFAAIPIVSLSAAKITGDRRTAISVATVGLSAYVAAKVIKTRVGRARPEVMRPGAIVREDAHGLGYPSGHAAVATAMATVLAAHLRGPLRWAPSAAAAVVGFSRVYVGAHLPHDVIGGAALGTVIGSAATLGARNIS